MIYLTRCLTLFALVPFLHACGNEEKPRTDAILLSCQDGDGRCRSCSWEEAGLSHCRLTVFAETCPPSSTPEPSRSCPATPRASCDRSSTDYLMGEDGYADVDFYYGTGDLSAAAAECRSTPSTLNQGQGIWTVY